MALVLGQVSFAQAPAAQPKRSAAKKSAKAASSKKKQASAARRQRVKRAVGASQGLRPLAQDLFQARTPAAYQAVEKYAERHARDDASWVAGLVIGYARTLDGEYSKAIGPLAKARQRAGDLGDYVNHFLAGAYVEAGRPQEAVEILKDFHSKYPDSIFKRDALVTLANALLESGQAAEAINRLEGERSPVRADVELALARAWLATGNTERAVDALYRIFYTMPTSEQAAAADAELQQLALKGPITPPTTELRRTRADLLLKNRQASDAVPEYQTLLQQAGETDVRPLQMELAVALYRSGNHREASDILQQMGDQADEFRARRMFYQLEIARPDQEKVSEMISRMRDLEPTSTWFQEGLLSAGNTYLLKNDFKTAAGFYAELAARFPEGKYGPYAAWKSAWLELRLGRQAEAKTAAERYVDLYPQGAELSAALYWRGRIAEDEKDLPTARAYYIKAGERFFNSYYAALSRERLAEIDPAGEKADDPLLRKIVVPRPPANVPLAAPADDLRVQKSKLLENAGLVDFAVRELEAAGRSSEWLAGETARLYRDSGVHYRALQTVKRALPGYYSFQLSDLPRPVWEYLFPRAYWGDLSHYASANGLDPYLVASLIRQESEFNATALSRANAMGLMQILPGTGKRVAKQLRIRGFDSSLLFDPTYNLQLGTRYFRDLLKRYDGRIEYALAAYNAGPERVDEWKKGTYRDMPEFVESIPFTETREYVQAIVRNVSLYQRLYENP